VREERDALPWRRLDDPWAILVSEVMLAQTQVGRVAVKFPPFLERFPDPACLAGAPLSDVLARWEGLGYPRRAVALQRAAASIVEQHGGRVPEDLDQLLALPGVGPYTARAVLAFAFDRPVMPVDTNIARVLARAMAARAVSRASAEELAAGLSIAGVSGRELARAVMDLGAVVCRSRAPRCDRCPLGDTAREPEAPRCRWRALGGQEDPAQGSWGVSGKQPRYVGSDREGRGRLLRAARAGVLARSGLAAAAGWPDDPERAERVVRSLVADRLLEHSGDGGYRLPGSDGGSRGP
jgi:A/G-specific adenine glycosylase